MGYGLTEMQSKVLGIILCAIDEDGCAPSFDEIMTKVGLKSKSGVHRILSALEERGHIHRMKGRARAIALGKRPIPKCCPFCGVALDAADFKLQAASQMSSHESEEVSG